MGSPVFWGRASGGSGAINVPDDYFFADATARDSYFTSNPTELVEGVQVVVGTTSIQLQEYRSSAWVDITAVVRGPAGADGTDGTNGTNGASYPETEGMYVIDGGGEVITTGSKGFLQLPFTGTITGWTVLSDQSGSIEIDVKKASYSDFPTTASIAGTDLPTLSTAQKNSSSSLTGWTTTITAGDILEFIVNSVTAVTRVSIIINFTRST